MNTSRQAATMGVAPRKLAITAGTLYLITHVTTIVSQVLYSPILHNANYIVGGGADTRVLAGALCELILALTVVGTAVALYPVVRRYNEGLATGYLALRTLEAGIIATGIVPLLAIVTLRQQQAGDAATLVAIGNALVGINEWTALIGQGLTCGVNTVVLAALLYRAGLVPRVIPTLGLIGGPLVFAYNTAVLFGIQPPAWVGLAVLPIFAWEVSLALRLITRGFTESSNAAAPAGSEPQAQFAIRPA